MNLIQSLTMVTIQLNIYMKKLDQNLTLGNLYIQTNLSKKSLSDRMRFFDNRLYIYIDYIKQREGLNLMDDNIINTNKGKRIINDLFIYLSKNPKKHISNDLFKNEQKERVVADFISGMTDRYAINLYNKIK